MLRKTAQWILLLSACTPFVVFSNTAFGPVNGKMFFLRAIVTVVILLTTFQLFSKKNSEELFAKIGDCVRDPLTIILFATVCLAGISTLTAYNPNVAFFGEPILNEGFLTGFSFFLLYICIRLYFQEKEWKYFFIISATAGSILAVVALFQSIIFTHLVQYRPDALSGNPVYLAGYFIFTAYCALQIWFDKEKKAAWISILGPAAFFMSILGCALTQTRSALFAMMFASVFCGVFGWLNDRESVFKKITWKRIGLGSIGVAAVLILLFGATYRASFWRTVPVINRLISPREYVLSGNARLMYFKQSVTHVAHDGAKRLLLGWGPDNYVYSWEKYYSPETFYYDANIATRAHNKLVDVLIMNGVVGLAGFILIWFYCITYTIRVVRKNQKNGLSTIFFGLSYALYLMFAFDTPVTYLAWTAVIAHLAYLYHEA
jgi:hypothetical protein